MGADKLFHKRKAKKAENLKRNQAKRAPYERVLIVCEGEKTEPHYFQELCDHYRLNSAHVVISGACGSAPKCVVKRAKELYWAEKRKGISYDRVYCVFDKDTHNSYHSALSTVKNAKPKATFFAINSVPCFEFWLLLHFGYTDKPFHGTTGAKSSGDQVLVELKKKMTGYAKGSRDCFKGLSNKQMEEAIRHSKRALKSANKSGTDNPTTRVHELVEYLQKLTRPGK